MFIHFKHVEDNAGDENDPRKGPLVLGDGADEAIAVCSLHTFTIYEQEFQNDPSSPHKSLVDDMTDFPEPTSASSLGAILAANWEADTRALWAMLKTASVANLYDAEVKPFKEWSLEHAGDDVDVYKLHMLVTEEVDSCFPSLTALTQRKQRKQRKRKADVHEDGAVPDEAGVQQG